MSFLLYASVTLLLIICIFLVLLVLIQKGRGGGLASAFGGGGGNTAFGSKTGDVLTWATSIVFGIFLILAVVTNVTADHIKPAALESYLEQLRQVKGLDGVARIDLASLMQLPGVCQEPRDESDEIAKHGDVVRQLTHKSIEKLNQMRAREGQSLFNDL